MLEAHVFEELGNIALNQPVFPGDTISHPTARACEDRGWVRRDGSGNLRITAAGIDSLYRWLLSGDDSAMA